MKPTLSLFWLSDSSTCQKFFEQEGKRPEDQKWAEAEAEAGVGTGDR